MLPKYNGKDKTFFFFNYEGQRQRQGSTTLNIVPTAAERAGDLSVISTPIYDPFSGDPTTGLRTPFPNNQIPSEPDRSDFPEAAGLLAASERSPARAPILSCPSNCKTITIRSPRASITI